MDTSVLPLAAFILTAIGWLSRELWRWRNAKRQAAHDASKILSERKRLLEDMISKTQDTSSKQTLTNQLDEVSAALLGLHSQRLRHVLKDAGLPAEEMLIANGRSRLQPQQAISLSKVIEEVKSPPPPISARGFLLMLGDAYYLLQRYEEAKDIYNKIIDLNPYDHVAIRHRGAVDVHMKKNEAAIADFNRSLELKPDEPIALHDRGIAFRNLKKYKDALDDFNRALELKPNHYIILDNRGATYAKLERYDEALADFNRSLELRPDDAGTLYNLACLFSLLKKTDDALSYLGKAVSLDKKYREMAKTDKDFDNIRDDPRFKKLIESD